MADVERFLRSDGPRQKHLGFVEKFAREHEAGSRVVRGNFEILDGAVNDSGLVEMMMELVSDDSGADGDLEVGFVVADGLELAQYALVPVLVRYVALMPFRDGLPLVEADEAGGEDDIDDFPGVAPGMVVSSIRGGDVGVQVGLDVGCDVSKLIRRYKLLMDRGKLDVVKKQTLRWWKHDCSVLDLTQPYDMTVDHDRENTVAVYSFDGVPEDYAVLMFVYMLSGRDSRVVNLRYSDFDFEGGERSVVWDRRNDLERARRVLEEILDEWNGLGE